ncbi:MAG: transposase, partial [Shewanella sp.]
MTAHRKPRIVHSEQFKSEALQLAAKIGVTSAAKQLNVSPSQFYAWRNAFSRKQSSSERENALAVEVARLKRLLAEQ